jgi:hypothetical protein
MLNLYSQSVATLLGAGFAVLFVAIFAIQFLALEGGFQLGLRQHRDTGEPVKDGVSTVTAGMLGLLSFTLGLTISFAQTRFEARRDSVLTEANTIGTAWLRAGLLGGENATNLRHLIETYAGTRLAFAQANDPATAEHEIALGNSQQTAIWTLAADAARANPTPVTALVVASLNDMIDASLSERFTFTSGLPTQVSAMLLVGSVLALGATGFQLGLDGRRRLALTSLLLAMWTGGMTVTADLSNPRLGEIRATARPLLWTIQGFSEGGDK